MEDIAFVESNDYVTYEYTLPDEQYDFSFSIYQKGDGNRDGIYYIYQALDSDGNIIAAGLSGIAMLISGETTRLTMAFLMKTGAVTIYW